MRPLTIFARKTLLRGLKPIPNLNFRNFTSSAFHLEVLKETTIPRDVIQARILEVLKSYEKIDAKLISPEAHFAKDLKLDSLDAVEVVMAIEEEFSIEIPDHDADEIKSVTAAIEYVASRSDAH